MIIRGIVARATQSLTLIASILMVAAFSGMPSVVLAAGDTWTKKADMPKQRWSPAAAAVNGKIYVIGGGLQGTTVTTGTLYEYDPATDEWETKADILTPRVRHAACAVNGKIYVIGGTPENTGDDVLASVEEYDPATDTWARRADMPTPRHSMTASVVDGKIYAIGGSRGSMGLNRAISVPKVEVYDPATDTWEKRADMLGGQALAASAGAIGGKIHLVKVSETDEYDPATDTWKLGREPMLTPRIIARGAVVNDKFYTISGYAPGTVDVVPVVEVYDPVTDRWTKGKSIPTPRGEFGIAALDGKIYAFGGYNSLGMEYYSTVEEYTPEGWPFAVLPRDRLATMWGNIKRSR